MIFKHQGKIEYYLKGEQPRLLILTGLHGDEAGIITVVEQVVKDVFCQLPPFLYIPRASPSAVRQKTRHNREGLDINRYFFKESPSNEARAIMAIVKSYVFDLCLSIHEDVQQNCFYLYDTQPQAPQKALDKFRADLIAQRINLLNGLDDADDPILGHHFVNGYLSLSVDKKIANSGTFEAWAIKKGLARRALTPEIPGQVSRRQKQQIIELIFQHFVLAVPSRCG